MPVEGVVTAFGWRTHPITGDRRFHEGVDIAAPEGTEIRAVQSAWSASRRRGGYGNVVEPGHPDGSVSRAPTPPAFTCVVAIASRWASPWPTWADRPRDRPHLHFEVERDGKAVDPNAYLSTCGGP